MQGLFQNVRTYKQVLKQNWKDHNEYNPQQVGGSEVRNFIFIVTQVKHSIKVKISKRHCHGFYESKSNCGKGSALRKRRKLVANSILDK